MKGKHHIVWGEKQTVKRLRSGSRKTSFGEEKENDLMGSGLYEIVETRDEEAKMGEGSERGAGGSQGSWREHLPPPASTKQVSAFSGCSLELLTAVISMESLCKIAFKESFPGGFRRYQFQPGAPAKFIYPTSLTTQYSFTITPKFFPASVPPIQEWPLSSWNHFSVLSESWEIDEAEVIPEQVRADK